MHKGIQHDIGALEEQLEKIETIVARFHSDVSATTLELTDPLWEQVRLAKMNTEGIRIAIEENLLWEKCFPLNSVLDRLITALIAEAEKRRLKIAVMWRESGKIPLSVAQAVMPSIMAFLQILIQRMLLEPEANRRRDYRLGTRAVTIELEGTADFFLARILDDGVAEASRQALFRKDLQKIRARVGRVQGFCSFAEREPYGIEFELKVPVPRSRISVYVASSNGIEVAIPMISVLNVQENIGKEELTTSKTGIVYTLNKDLEVPVCTIDEKVGIATVSEDFLKSFRQRHFLIVGAADFQFALVLDGPPAKCLVRLADGSRYLQKDAWHQMFALHQVGTDSHLVPFVSGEAIVEFQNELLERL